MASQGPFFPLNISSNAATPEDDEAWVNPTNVGADDGAEASITAATYDLNDITEQLRCRSFGDFAIPAGATIDGILVEIEKHDNGTGGNVDFRVQLRGTAAELIGDNKADTVTNWPTNATIISYGGATDLWGLGAAATPDLINNSNFGVVISAQATANNTDAFIDFVRITVFYHLGAFPFPRRDRHIVPLI